MGELVNDVHSRLNPTVVARVARPASLEELQASVAEARDRRRPVAMCGSRHAMGGQQFCTGGTLLDMGGLTRILELDEERGLVEVEAGVQWPALIDALADTQWSIRQKQAGANDFSLGGAVSANIHGRGLAFPPLVSDVERLVLVGAEGDARACSRVERAELFGLVCGGYGLVGALYSVTLRLTRRRWLERAVELVRSDELMLRLEERIAAGYVYGDVQLEIDPASPGFLRRGVVSCYRPIVGASGAVPASHSGGEWDALLRLAHTDKRRRFELAAADALRAAGQVYASDRLQLAPYAPGRHWDGSSDVIGELCVPRPALQEFLEATAQALRAHEADVVHGAVRLVERDDETLLAWARERWACTTIELHVEHDAVSVGRTADTFRALIDVALAHGGSYSLTYHRWARRDQIERAHPRIHELVRAKRARDPAGVFASDWYRHLLHLLDAREAA